MIDIPLLGQCCLRNRDGSDGSTNEPVAWWSNGPNPNILDGLAARVGSDEYHVVSSGSRRFALLMENSVVEDGMNRRKVNDGLWMSIGSSGVYQNGNVSENISSNIVLIGICSAARRGEHVDTFSPTQVGETAGGAGQRRAAPPSMRRRYSFADTNCSSVCTENIFDLSVSLRFAFDDERSR